MPPSAPPEPADTQRPPPSVFLSYCSGDRSAAQIIRDSLPQFGLEVWFDESELNGGDAWDQKIRRQIRECDFFMPVISAQTEARSEGYFRREWRLAVVRAQDMADDHTFILPVTIDDTSQAGARVPEIFLGIQWLRLPGGEPTPALEALCRRLVAGDTNAPAPARRSSGAMPFLSQSRATSFPPFPREEPGQKIQFWGRVGLWVFQWAWAAFLRVPRWLRILVYIWVALTVMSRGCSSSDERPGGVSRSDAKEIKDITDHYQGSANRADVAKLGEQIAKLYADATSDDSGPTTTILAIPFNAPPGDAAAQKLADATFAQVYGEIAMSQHGHVALVDQPLASPELNAAAAQGRDHHANYVVFGAVDNQMTPPSLALKIVHSSDAAVVWSQSTPVAGADPVKIAKEIDAKTRSLEDTQ